MYWLKKNFTLLIILSSIIVLLFSLNNSKIGSKIFQFLGEKSFLELHINKLAIIFLERSKEISKDDYKTYFLLGRVYFVNGKLENSIENYSYSIKLKSDYKEAYYGRGLAYGFTTKIFYDEAKNDFEKYIEMDNDEYAKTGLHAYGAWAGYNDLAWIYFLQGDFENAEKTARAGLEIAPQIPWLQNMLGTTLLAQKKCREGKKYLESAEKILKETSVDSFGEAYSGDNPSNWEKSKVEMEKAIKKNIKKCDEQKT